MEKMTYRAQGEADEHGQCRVFIRPQYDSTVHLDGMAWEPTCQLTGVAADPPKRLVLEGKAAEEIESIEVMGGTDLWLRFKGLEPGAVLHVTVGADVRRSIRGPFGNPFRGGL